MIRSILSRQSIFSALIVSALLLLAIRAASVSHRGFGDSFGWAARLSDDQVVTSVESESPAARAGLTVGDKIIGFEELEGFTDPSQRERLIHAYRAMDVESSYKLKILRSDQVIDFQVSSSYLGKPETRANILQYHVIALIYLLFGASLLLLKPFNLQAMAFSALMMGLSTCYIPAISARLPAGVGAAVDIIQYGFIFATPFFFAHFFLVFPTTLARPSAHKKIVAGLYILLALQVAAYLAPKLIDLHVPAFYASRPWLDRLRVITFDSFYYAFLSAIMAGVVLMGLRSRRESSAQGRRKIRLILLGMAIGLPPILFVNSLARIAGFQVTSMLALICGLLSLAFPLAFAYAIIKYRVMDVRLILRRSAKYLLISRLIQTFEATAIVFLIYFIALDAGDEIGRRMSAEALIIIGALSYSVILFAVSKINAQIMPALDRLFFKSAYSTEKILIQLARAIPTVNDQKSLLDLTAVEIMRAIGVGKIAFFLPVYKKSGRPGSFGGISSGNDKRPPAVAFGCWVADSTTGSDLVDYDRERVLATNSPLVKRLIEGNCSLEVDFEDPSTGAHRLPSQEQELLGGLDTNLLVPIKTGGTIFGIMSLGHKLSELPYTPVDVELLESVAAQMTVALERIWLLKEIAEQERLKRELEIARMVQMGSFPVLPDNIHNLDMVATCIPALTVGGDYYDFISLRPGKLAIALGDVSGKGISAALIMSSLQASLRSLASDDEGHMGDLVSSVNKLLCRSTDSGKFATFFYCLYDEGAGTLTYVNAGHEPPLLLHRGKSNGAQAPSSLLRPFKGGMVLGVMEGSTYEQETISLSRGDLLVGYTDGVTEARNSTQDEYGEQRVISLVTENSHLSAGELQQLIIEDIRNFVGGARQHDDITLLVIKVV
jgi:sigma-B regulation protein RsbU (phosphoserine phosphatase)